VLIGKVQQSNFATQSKLIFKTFEEVILLYCKVSPRSGQNECSALNPNDVWLFWSNPYMNSLNGN